MKCFVAGTLVLTASGLRNIEEIEIGDSVLSANPDSDKNDYKKVLETYVRKTRRLIHIIIGKEEIVTTEEHPFWIIGKGFVPAINLVIGDLLLDAYGNTIKIDSIYRGECNQDIEVFNLNVEDYHTYFVGGNCILVHNSECGGSYGSIKNDKANKKFENEEVHHMPADSSSPLARRDGPAIRMDKADHRQTASCGRSKAAQQYRQEQSELIKNGKFKDAINMDIDDIHSKFGDKYDKGISELLDYVNKLESEGKI
jgi:hypothetical protein